MSRQIPNNPSTGKTLSRRHFLKVTSLGAAAGALGFDLTPESLAAMAARRQSGTLRVAWEIPATLDPRDASADSEIAFLNAVYDYLIDVSATSEVVPRLASDWSISGDGLTYTFKIREGVTFHDGSTLTPGDVVWTYNRLKEAGATATLYENIVSIEEGDDHSVVFTLAETNPDFLFFLSDNHALILQADAAGIGEEFNGTGPFMLSEYLPGDRAVFTANADYFGGAPGVETLEFIYFGDAQAAVSALRDGVVDVVLRLDNATFLSLVGDAAFNAVDIPTNGHDVMRIRSDREPGSDERVRQAFKLATDREAIFERVALGFGAPGRDSPIGPIYGAYYTEDTPIPPRDAEAAAALLADAGYADGIDITLYVPNSGNRPAFAEALAAQWAEAGIRTTIELQDEAAYYADEGWLEVDFGITGWGSRPTPQIYLTSAVRTGANWNEAHFSDPEVDELIDLAGSTVDDAERAEAFMEIQRIMIERGPYIIAYFFAMFMVTSADIEGIDLHPFAGRTNFNGASL